MFTFVRRLLSSPDAKKSTYFLDNQGRRIIYHGVNIANYSKHCAPQFESGRGCAGHPWHGESEAANLERWGFNLVRYLVHWEAIEPQRGTYNEAYLNRVVEDVRMYARHGVDVIIDVHQDLFAQKYSGNGFPDWAVRDEGKPFKLQEPWAMNYLQPAVRACFANFWKNKDALLDAYIAMIGKLYLKVKGEANVIGIDVMNEPWPEGWPLTFERNDLTAFYKKLRQEVWKNNGASGGPILMFEPWMSTSAGYPTNLEALPWRPEAYQRVAYLPHYYDFFCEQNKPYERFNRYVMQRAFNIRLAEAQEFKCPIIFGEFGFPSQAKNYLQAMDDFLELADEHSVGWAYWSYDKTIHNDRGLILEDGTPTPFLKSLVRIYPQRIPSKDAHFKFSQDVFTMCYKAKDSLPAEIYVPAEWDVMIDTQGTFQREGTKVILEKKPRSCEQTVRISVLSRNGFPMANKSASLEGYLTYGSK